MECKICSEEYNVETIIRQFGDIYWKNDYCCPVCFSTALIKKRKSL